ARALGPQGRGEYFVPITAAMMAFQLASLGLPDAQFRLWSRDATSRDQLIAAGVAGSFCFGLLGAATMLLVHAWNPGGVFAGVGWAPMVLAVTVIPIQIHNSVMVVFLPVNGRLPLVNWSRLAGAVVQTAGALLLYATGTLTVTGVVLLWGASFLLPWLVRLPALRRLHRPGTGLSLNP